MDENTDLSEELLKKLNHPKLPEDYTVDDFFDEMNIPSEERTNFVFAAVFKQIWDHIEKKEDGATA